MAIDRRVGNKTPNTARYDDKPGFRSDSGPFIGVIKNNTDNLRKGRLQVYIPELCGPDPSDSTKWRTVTYAAPFAGATVPKESEQNTFDTTRQSYGMWFTPPDLETRVLCTFVQGDPARGYYFAVLQDQHTHHMIPGIASSTDYKFNSDQEETELTEEETTDAFPVGEFGSAEPQKNFAKNEKPVHKFLARILKTQGLLADKIRGLTTSTSQRESPSRVFGISTPGRPEPDIAEQTNNFQDLQAAKSVSQKIRKPQTRKPGHTFVMDDGDLAGDNQLVRLRTASGHQILMHDTANVLYIANADGTAWLEFTESGRVDVYAKNSMSVRSGQINMHADNEFNIHAGSNMNIVSEGKLHLQGNSGIDQYTDGPVKITANGGVDVSGSEITISATGKVGIKGEAGIDQSGLCINLNSAPVSSAAEATKKNTEVKPTPKRDAQKLRSTVRRAPTMEPWPEHEEKQGDQAAASGLEDLRNADVENVTQQETSGRPGLESARDSDGDISDVSEQDLAEQLQFSSIGPLSAEQVQALMVVIGKRESGGDYSAVNSIGYAGKYQFGAAALEDIGYVKPGTFQQGKKLRKRGEINSINDVVQDPDVWTGLNGVDSLEAWLRNEYAQEEAQFALLSQNYNTLLRIGALKDDDTAEDVAGTLMVAHLLGPGGAKNWAKGQGTTDAYGTGGNEYYALGTTATKVA